MHRWTFVVVLAIVPTVADTQAEVWRYTSDRDPLTNADRSFITARAASVGPSDRKTDPWLTDATSTVLALTLGCRDGTPHLLIAHRPLLGEDGVVEVTMRVDPHPAVARREWTLVDGTGPSSGTAAPVRDVPDIVRAFRAGGSRVVLQVYDPGDGGVVNGQVSLLGFAAAARRLPCLE